MKCNHFIILAFLFVAASCSVSGSDSNQPTIVGEWEWIKSTGSFAGHTITPDSTGYSKQQIHFDLNSKFAFFRADTLVASGQYSLVKESGKLVIKYSTGMYPRLPDQWVDLSNNDTLILRDRCADCYRNTYRRHH